MQSTLEKLEGLACRLKITVPKEKVEQTYQQQVEEAAKTVTLKGFRPGNVPLNIVKTRLGSKIQQDVFGQLMQTSFQEAINEHNLRVAGQPRIQPKKVIVGEPLEYEAIFEIFPEFKLNDLTGVTIEKTAAEVTDADVDNVLSRMQREQADWVTVDRAAKTDDRLIIDFEGFVENKPIEKGSAQNFAIILGSKQMIPGFEDGLIGAKPNQKLEIKVTFPKEYHPDLASKEATFNITVHEVQEPKLPSLEEELPKKLQFQGDATALRGEVRKQMEKTLKNNLDAIFRSRVLEKLIELNPILLPQGLIAGEIKYLQHLAQEEQNLMKSKGMQPTDMSFEFYKQQAEKRVRLGLLLADVIKQYQIKVDQAKVRQKILEVTSDYPNPEEAAKWYYQNKELLTEVETLSLEEQVVEKLLEKATITENSVSYDDAMKAGQQTQ